MSISLETSPSQSPWSKTGCARLRLQHEAAAATSARGRRTPFSASATSPSDKVRHSSKDRREIGALRPNIDALCPRADIPGGCTPIPRLQVRTLSAGGYSGDIPEDIQGTLPRGAYSGGGYSRGRYSTSAYVSTVIGARKPCRRGSASRGAPPRSHP